MAPVPTRRQAEVDLRVMPGIMPQAIDGASYGTGPALRRY